MARSIIAEYDVTTVVVSMGKDSDPADLLKAIHTVATYKPCTAIATRQY